MEWLKDLGVELIWALAGGVFTFLAARLGILAERIKKEALQREDILSSVKDCVQAVEMMDREKTGEEKLSHATRLITDLLSEKGIALSPERLRVLIESVLSRLQGVFREV